jgi:hypothetical protein
MKDKANGRLLQGRNMFSVLHMDLYNESNLSRLDESPYNTCTSGIFPLASRYDPVLSEQRIKSADISSKAAKRLAMTCLSA